MRMVIRHLNDYKTTDATPRWLLDRLVVLHQQATDGMPLSVRYHRILPIQRPDNNIFLPAQVSWILQNLQPLLSTEEQALAGAISQSISLQYAHYQNRWDAPTFNFYPCRKNIHFPGGYFLQYLPGMKLPEDADDTALLLQSGNYTASFMQASRSLMLEMAQSQKKIWGFWPKSFRQFTPYATWLGTQQIPLIYDATVMGNVVAFVAEKDLPFHEVDAQSLDFITKTVEEKYYLNHPYYASCYYANPFVNYYLWARMVETIRLRREIKAERLAHLLIAQANLLKKAAKRPLDLVLLSTALLRLGVEPKLDNIVVKSRDMLRYPFCLGGLLSMMDGGVAQRMARQPFSHFSFSNELLNWTLLLELKLLARNR